jgi:hypothetical protein
MATILTFTAAFFFGATVTIWVLFSIGVRNNSRITMGEYLLVGMISTIPLAIAIYTFMLQIERMV